jgi:hypothetical protein
MHPTGHTALRISLGLLCIACVLPLRFICAQDARWSLRPIASPAVPTFDDQFADDWVRTPVDAFVLQALREKGLAPSPEADRRTLIRRLYFDLIGLPPTPDEVEAFIVDLRPGAYEAIVERLLASPHYGERWARHWLDVARYADTHGYDKDKLRPNAWPYRDYVIRALNADKPYGQFVREQIAGDILEHPPAVAEAASFGNSADTASLGNSAADGTIATGFLAAGPFDWVGHIEVADGTLEKRRVRNLDRDEMVAAVMNVFCSTTAQCARCHDHKFDPIPQADYYSLQAVFAGIDRADRPYAKDATGKELFVFAAATDFAPEGNLKPTQGAMRKVFVLARGDESQPEHEAAPGGLTCLADLADHFQLPADHAEGSRRTAMAAWIIDERNPLTWRSIVNRVWQYHFGQGIAATANDFGRMGNPPTHPELLDWLATEFRDGGRFIGTPQSLKELHRLLVTSSIYRQAAGGDAEAAAIDGENRYLWRSQRRRLSAEEIRDAILAVSGKLDRTMYGPAFRAFEIEKPEHSPHYLYEKHDVDDAASHRRSVYRFVVRSVPDPLLSALDCADASQSVARRDETVTPASALAMLNDRFVVRMSEHFAERVLRDTGDIDDAVGRAFRLALARAPSADEVALLRGLAARHGLPAACRVIVNMNEFVYVD